MEASFSEGSFNLGIYFNFSGTYTVSDNYFTLTFDGGGQLFSDENGKWELEADTLTLRFNDGSIIVLERIYYVEDIDEPQLLEPATGATEHLRVSPA